MDKDALEEVKEKQSKMLAAQSSIANMDISGRYDSLFRFFQKGNFLLTDGSLAWLT